MLYVKKPELETRLNEGGFKDMHIIMRGRMSEHYNSKLHMYVLFKKCIYIYLISSIVF